MVKFKPAAIGSLHGFKSHGKWQGILSQYLTTKNIPVISFDYGYQFFRSLIPGFKDRLVKKFYEQYCELLKNRNYKININDAGQRPSIIAHSLGSYVLCTALLKYPDIRFDKVILCGSIVDESFNWDQIFRRNQVHFVRNEYSRNDKIVPWGWVLSNKPVGSGHRGFKYTSDAFFQEEFQYFDHGTCFEGNHMEKYWLPFFLKSPPKFTIRKGKDINSIQEFTKYFDQTTTIDDDAYQQESPFWPELSIPDNRAEEWVDINPDIYSFLLKDEKSDEVIGYINAMPLKKDIFEKLLIGKMHDNEIEASHILPYDENTPELDLYIMSIALDKNFRQNELGLRDLGYQKLFDSLSEKLIYYYKYKKIKIKRLAAVGWTHKGERLCNLFRMKDTGYKEEKTNKPVYLLEIKHDTPIQPQHKAIRELIQIYQEGQ